MTVKIQSDVQVNSNEVIDSVFVGVVPYFHQEIFEAVQASLGSLVPAVGNVVAVIEDQAVLVLKEKLVKMFYSHRINIRNSNKSFYYKCCRNGGIIWYLHTQLSILLLVNDFKRKRSP